MKNHLTLLFVCFSTVSIGQTFSEMIKVVADDRDAQDRFGWSVDISGNYAIIGAYGDDYGPSNPNMGSAYIFEKEGIADWEMVQKINNSDQDDYDRFGYSVAIDGNYAIIGAYGEDHDLMDGASLSKAGSAYIFERAVDGTWSEMQKIIPDDRESGDEFGWSVDISGTTVIVGAHFESHDETGLNYIYHAGSAYIFDLVGGTWTQTQKIVGSGRAPDIVFPDGGGGDDVSDLFGGSVSISGDRLIVGAHHHDYDATGGSPLNETGAAYIFERSGGVWSEVAKLQNSDRETEDAFGFSVSIDGNFAVVSAYEEDENAEGGSSLSNAGSVYIFERNIVGNWNQIQKIVAGDRSTGDRFGWDVYIDGETIAIGAARSNTDEAGEAPLTNAGAAYAFHLDPDTETWLEINKMNASDRQLEDEFGTSVAISGEQIIVGAYQQNFDASGIIDIDDAGAAYFYSQFECTPTSSSQVLTLCEGQVVEVGPYTHSETGVYVNVIFSESGCDSTVTTDLTIIPAPSSSQEVEICFGYSYDIGSSSHTESGVYSDTITSESGCDSIVHTTLMVSPENAVTHDITICWGESYSIGASTYTETGIYTDVITSWALCDCTITTNLTVQLPVDKSISQSLNVLTAGADDAEYQWIKCNPYEPIVGTGANEQTYVAPVIGEYAVIVTEGECFDTSSCVYVDLLTTEENQSLSKLNIYPNPNSDGYFIIDLTGHEPQSYHGIITNLTGQVVHEIRFHETVYPLDLNNLPPGVYLLTLSNEESARSIRLIIQ